MTNPEGRRPKLEPGMVRGIRKLNPTTDASRALNTGIPREPFLSDDFVVDPAKRQVFEPWIPGAGVQYLGEERSFVRMQLMDLQRTKERLDSGVKTSHGETRPLTERDRQNLEESIKHLKRVTGEKLEDLNSFVAANRRTYTVYYNSRRPGSYRNPGSTIEK